MSFRSHVVRKSLSSINFLVLLIFLGMVIVFRNYVQLKNSDFNLAIGDTRAESFRNFNVKLDKEVRKLLGRSLDETASVNEDIGAEDFYAKIRNSRVIFVGGFARSGTTLMRALLDVHENIYCGPETKVIPTILDFYTKYRSKSGAMIDLENAGINSTQLDLAMASFIYSIMDNHGRKASRLCAKDPHVLYHMAFLQQLFPQAKFIYMVRDGRAAAYSLLEQLKEKKVLKRYKAHLISWNSFNRQINAKCLAAGSERCLMVKYEQLILHPKRELLKIMSFLNESYVDELLEHEKFIGDRIQVSKTEWSTDQIMRPIHSKSLTTWIDDPIPGFDSQKMHYLLPMLKTFNYSHDANELDYRKDSADANILANNKRVSRRVRNVSIPTRWKAAEVASGSKRHFT